MKELMEVVGMMNSEMARFQIQDRVREADAYRVGRATRKVRESQRRAAVRKVSNGALTALLWPVKH